MTSEEENKFRFAVRRGDPSAGDCQNLYIDSKLTEPFFRLLNTKERDTLFPIMIDRAEAISNLSACGFPEHQPKKGIRKTPAYKCLFDSPKRDLQLNRIHDNILGGFNWSVSSRYIMTIAYCEILASGFNIDREGLKAYSDKVVAEHIDLDQSDALKQSLRLPLGVYA